jgi:glycosyltransferase involved in cell wall biosynthesis
MKILLWPSQYLPSIGGLEVMTHQLAKQLQNNGHQVLVMTTGEEFKTRTFEGIPVFTLPFVNTLFHCDLKGIKQILEHIHQILRTFSPDIVNIHGWLDCFAFYQLRIFSQIKIPFCLTIHGLLEQMHSQTKTCLELWSKANGINTVSRFLVQALEKLGMRHPCLRAIYNGYPISPQPLSLPPLKSPRLVMVGRLSEEKCFDVAFHAMKILTQTWPHLKLCLVGGGGQYQPLSELRRALGLEHSIEMTDFVRPDKVERYIDEATLVLVPSYYESFCLVALEAALRGRPVIGSDVFGLREVIEPHQTGVLVPPNDPTALADAVNQLLRAPQKIEQMGRAAHARAAHLFSIENTTQNYLNMYQEVLSAYASR